MARKLQNFTLIVNGEPVSGDVLRVEIPPMRLASTDDEVVAAITEWDGTVNLSGLGIKDGDVCEAVYEIVAGKAAHDD